MAKDNKKGNQTVAEVNSSNLDESLKNANKIDQEILTMATDKLDKEDKERRADEIARKIKKANYQNFRCHIDFKYFEECADIEKDMLKKQKEQLDRLTSGQISAVEYEDEFAKIGKEGTKSINDRADARRTRIRELQKQYGEWYGMSWDDPFVRANRAIREGAQ
jgi:hypothetical protein